MSDNLTKSAYDSDRARRIRTFDYYQEIYAEQGFCTNRSPEDRMCTKRAGHDDPLRPGHHAEDKPGRVVEEWLDGAPSKPIATDSPSEDWLDDLPF